MVSEGGALGLGGTSQAGGAPSVGGVEGLGGADGAGGDLGASGGGGGDDAPMLPDDRNPVIEWFEDARNAWSAELADVVLSYQQSNGGWAKNVDYATAGMGSGGDDLGTFDNGATTTELVFLAERYIQTGQAKFADAVREALDYTLEAQYPSGGWPQYYPLRGGYSDHVTFNDNAMAHVLTVLVQAVRQKAPFDTDLFTDDDREECRAAIALGLDYILKSQVEQNGALTVWCAQHGAEDYLPKAARAYELESLSGSESVGVLAFLMTQPQTSEIETAVRSGLAWYRSPNTYVNDTTYDTDQCPDGNPIVAEAGSKMWYRFYDLSNNRGFFSDRDGGVYYDIMEISQERRCGYRWAGNWGDTISSFAESVSY